MNFLARRGVRKRRAAWRYERACRRITVSLSKILSTGAIVAASLVVVCGQRVRRTGPQPVGPPTYNGYPAYGYQYYNVHHHHYVYRPHHHHWHLQVGATTGLRWLVWRRHPHSRPRQLRSLLPPPKPLLLPCWRWRLGAKTVSPAQEDDVPSEPIPDIVPDLPELG